MHHGRNQGIVLVLFQYGRTFLAAIAGKSDRVESVAAIGVIRRKEGRQTLGLAQRNAKWTAYALVGGHKWVKESFRACVIREIDEELGLVEGTDFLTAEEPIAHLVIHRVVCVGRGRNGLQNGVVRDRSDR
ncbi:MAG: NUDIX domain-containing protein [Planctomycetaceae bacterium]|jgi:8-oxo-dGTP pyrophosphatase MutT (NUDIX family)|nr:NUDIX domain-containing protein [Planctomycetaceae bacterium]MBT6155199.1 NUDIX domain-containing protein [Planctomycetaceae bacterium]MBT6483285.1 NUDIX domain-containing protein [Planctomycetaceae bacterium]MBT6494612.1 NUDIX domain-containing protein [Planctomycetaceae bacterium]